jgi:hypothetical protein
MGSSAYPCDEMRLLKKAIVPCANLQARKELGELPSYDVLGSLTRSSHECAMSLHWRTGSTGERRNIWDHDNEVFANASFCTPRFSAAVTRHQFFKPRHLRSLSAAVAG